MFVLNPYELKIQQYLDSVQGEGAGMEAVLVKAASAAIEKAIHEAFNETRSRNFTLRMSNVAKPLCQLMAERDGMKRDAMPGGMLFKMIYGHVIEALFVSVVKASGINVTGEQGKVTLNVRRTDGSTVGIDGSFDLLLDDTFVYDVKSASSFSYKHKFESFDSLAADDPFGYVGQLFGYAEALGKKAGGWFVIDKTTGDIKVVEVPQDQAIYAKLRDKYVKLITDNVNAILDNQPFRRSFDDVEEKFQKSLTGNRVLGTTCGFCDFKRTCWPGVIHMAQPASSAKSPPWYWYTHVKAP